MKNLIASGGRIIGFAMRILGMGTKPLQQETPFDAQLGNSFVEGEAFGHFHFLRPACQSSAPSKSGAHCRYCARVRLSE
jgi:hypothetical protein